MLDSKEVRWETNHGLSSGTMNFDLIWPWTLIVQGHENLTSNISKTVTDTMMVSMELNRN